MSKSILDKMKSGELARLNPTVPDSKKEERATSILLATFRVVPEFALAMLADAGVTSSKRSRIECYTEVTFELPGSKKAVRPDGLIVIEIGRNYVVRACRVKNRDGSIEAGAMRGLFSPST